MMAARPKPRHPAKRNPWPAIFASIILLAILAFCIFVIVILGSLLCSVLSPVREASGIEVKPPQAVTTSAPAPAETPEPEPVRHRDDIVSEGRLLAYDLQEIMQDACEAYGVPYALALAIAEVETHFDPDVVSPPNDYGLMQINQINHEWLQGLGMDPLTYAGNIEAGLYIIGGFLDTYGDIEMALMAYNNGPNGARKLWDAGIYQTDYTRKITAALERWTSILEE